MPGPPARRLNARAVAIIRTLLVRAVSIDAVAEINPPGDPIMVCRGAPLNGARQ